MKSKTAEQNEGLQAAILEMEIRALQDFLSAIDRQNIENATRVILDCDGTVFVIGSGTSSTVARRFAHLLTCSGGHSIYLDSAQAMHGYSAILRHNDALIAFSRGGESMEVNYVINLAKTKNLERVGILENLSSTMSRLCSLIIHTTVKPENDAFDVIPFSSTIVQIAAGDLICAGVLEARGYSATDFAIYHPGGAVGDRLNG